MYSAGYHGCLQPNSEKQLTARADFKKKAQHKIGTPYSYMRSLVIDDLKVVLAGNDLTSGVLAPGGGSTGGGGQKPGGELEP